MNAHEVIERGNLLLQISNKSQQYE